MELKQFQQLESGFLPLKRGRVIKSLADATIRNVFDALVELVTNSDDSYTRGEEKGLSLNGSINIHLTRGHKGHCAEIKVVDAAEGMDHLTLKKAIEFSGDTSGFKEGRTVRGFFGRGLKESIIALGKGTILTLKDGIISVAEIYYDNEKKDAIYSLTVPRQGLTNEELEKLGFIDKSGTVTKIEITNDDKNYVPGRRTIEEHICKHYALRDINSSEKRKVVLIYTESDSKDHYGSTSPIKYIFPKGTIKYDKDVKIDNYSCHFQILESPEPLDSPRTPIGTSGLLIKTEGAILDNQLFGYEIDPVGLYFFGTIICPAIADIIRKGDDNIIDLNRGGLAWRHNFNKKLSSISKNILGELISKKKKELQLTQETKVEEPVEKILSQVCKKLSDLAKNELEDDSAPGPGEINTIVIRPPYANIELDKPRSLGVYVPKYLSDDEGTKTVSIKSSNPNIQIINPAVSLDFHKEDNTLLKSSFKVIGKIEDESAIITAMMGRLSATCDVRVAPLKKRGEIKDRDKSKGGGLFKKIRPTQEDKPIQRFRFLEKEGVLEIFVKFPGLERYLGEHFEHINNLESRALLAEIILEAFCRVISRKRAGKYFNEEIDPLMSDMDRLRKKASQSVYELIFNADLSNLINN